MKKLSLLAILTLSAFAGLFAQDRTIRGDLTVTGDVKSKQHIINASGVEADGSTDDSSAIQSAIDYAKTVIEAASSDDTNNIVTAKVILPSGIIAVGSTIKLYKGIELAGAGRSLTQLTHLSSVTALTGTAQAGASDSITLAAGASSTNDIYNGRLIAVTSGTGSGQTALICDYDGSTKVATVFHDWGTSPDNTSNYSIKENILETDITTIDNRQIIIRDLSIAGDGTDTGAGIRINDAYYDSSIVNVTISNCWDNIYITGSWTFKLDRVDAIFAENDNCFISNWTGGYAIGCRFDNAGRYGMHVTRDSSAPNLPGDVRAANNSVSSQVYTSYFQRNGRSGFYGNNLSTHDFFGGYFEDNNRDDGGYPDVELHDDASRGSRFTFFGCYASTSGSDESGTLTQWINIDKADALNIVGCHVYDGTDQIYDYAIETGASVENLNLIGNGSLDGQTGEVNANAATNVHWIGNNTEELKSYTTAATTTFEGQSNLNMILDAPADRRGEYSVAVAGTPVWYWGRGDTDENLPGDFYIDRTSGGGGEPDVVIDETTGFVGLSVLDPTSILDVKNNDIRIRTSQTPSSTSAAGWTGEICWDSDYIYVCVSGDGAGGSTDSWKRIAISTW